MKRPDSMLDSPWMACLMVLAGVQMVVAGGWSYVACASRVAVPGTICFGLEVGRLDTWFPLVGITIGLVAAGVWLLRRSEPGIRRLAGRY